MKITNCKQCDLSIGRKNIVNGVGDTNSQIMFVGEAPGYHEDKRGVPFVGKSGELLNKMLDYAGFVRDEVYITNVVKCRPPSNRTPYVREMQRCLPYLIDELKEVNPRIIVCLGRTAAAKIYPNFDTISKARLKPLLIGRTVVMVTYHPSYILVNELENMYYKDWKWISNAYSIFCNPFHTMNHEI
jgi:uracil-DNA glycosylase family 4